MIVGAFMPRQSKPYKIFNQRINEFRTAPLKISVLNPQQEMITQEGTKECCPCVSYMDEAGRTGCETGLDERHNTVQ